MLLDVTQEQRESGVVGVVNASILLVIRDKQERSVLQQALSDEGWQVTLAETAAKARWTANEQGFEFAVVDDRLPDDEPWYRVISDLQGSVVWIAALLNENKTGRANRAIRAGANFCWRHPVTPSRLQLLVTWIKGNLCSLCVGDLRIVPHRLEVQKRVQKRGQERVEKVQLSLTEFKLLWTFAKSPLRHFAKAELLEQVWGDTRLPEQTVVACVRQPRKKLDDNKIILTVWGVGYQLGRPVTRC